MKNYRSNNVRDENPISKDELLQDFITYSKKPNRPEYEQRDKQNYGKIVHNNNLNTKSIN